MLRIAYVELQYWGLGLTPEFYHWRQGEAFELLGRYRKAAHHFRRYLSTKDNPQVRGLLAYCYAKLGSWPEAAREYEAADKAMPMASLSMGYATALAALGKNDQALAVVAAIEERYAELDGSYRNAIETLKQRIRKSESSVMQDAGAGGAC